MLDAVLKVVPADTETAALGPDGKASPETPDGLKPADGQAEADPDEGDDDAEPAADLNPLVRKKINKLLKSRRELRVEKEQLESQLKSSRPHADIGSSLESFAKENNLSGDDLAFGLKTMAALRRGDWQAFYEAVAQPMRHAQEYLGLAIPRDLREKVQQGQMTEAAAKEFSRLRMDKQRSQVVLAAEQNLYAQRALTQTQDQVNRSVNAFEERLAASDPDYRHKAASVRRVAQAMLLERGGTINTVDDALTITRAAYEEVNATIRRQRPAPQATSRMPNGNGQTHSARAAPASLYEAAIQGLERSRNSAGHN